MNLRKRNVLKSAIENSLYKRQDMFIKILEFTYSKFIRSEKEITDVTDAVNVVSDGLKDLQKLIDAKRYVYKGSKDREIQGHWKYVNEEDTARYLIEPFMYKLFELKLAHQQKDGSFIYDSIIEGRRLNLLLEYKKVGYYFTNDCTTIDSLKLCLQENNLLNKNNKNYLRAGVRNQSVAYLSKSADSLSGYGLVVVTTGIWYSLLLTHPEHYDKDSLSRLAFVLGENELKDNMCDVLKNCGIPIMSFNVLDENAKEKIILFRKFIVDYVNYTKTFKSILEELKFAFIDCVERELK